MYDRNRSEWKIGAISFLRRNSSSQRSEFRSREIFQLGDDPSVWIPAQSDAEVSRSSGDEGGNDLDEGETEKVKPQKGDYRGDLDNVPGLEDESEEENEAPPGSGANESSSIRNEVALEQIQYQLRDLMKIME